MPEVGRCIQCLSRFNTETTVYASTNIPASPNVARVQPNVLSQEVADPTSKKGICSISQMNDVKNPNVATWTSGCSSNLIAPPFSFFANAANPSSPVCGSVQVQCRFYRQRMLRSVLSPRNQLCHFMERCHRCRLVAPQSAENSSDWGRLLVRIENLLVARWGIRHFAQIQGLPRKHSNNTQQRIADNRGVTPQLSGCECGKHDSIG